MTHAHVYGQTPVSNSVYGTKPVHSTVSLDMVAAGWHYSTLFYRAKCVKKTKNKTHRCAGLCTCIWDAWWHIWWGCRWQMLWRSPQEQSSCMASECQRTWRGGRREESRDKDKREEEVSHICVKRFPGWCVLIRRIKAETQSISLPMLESCCCSDIYVNSVLRVKSAF